MIRSSSFSALPGSEGLRYPGRIDSHAEPAPSDGHSAGVLFGANSSRLSMIRDISAFNRWRNPLIRSTVNDVQVVNNFIYWPEASIGGRMEASADTGNWTINTTMRGNVTISHPDKSSSEHPYSIDARAEDTNTVNLFVDDNLIYNHNVDNTGAPLGAPYWAPPPGGDPWSIVQEIRPGSGTGVINHLSSQPAQFPAVPLLRADRVELSLMANAGARPAFRDPVDLRILGDISSRVANRGYGTDGGYVSNPDEAGGYPNWTPIVRSPGIALPANPSADDDGDTYTNLEEWLHDLAFQLEGDRRIARFDTFEDGDANGWYPDSTPSNWTVATDGSTKVLSQSDTSGDAPAFLANTYFYNQRVQAKVKATAFNGSDRLTRVYARYSDAGNAYYVTLRSSNQIELKKLVNGAIVSLASQPFLINVNDWYSVRLTVVGGSLSTTVTNLATNATATLSYNDTNPMPPGYAAVGTYKASARFDDVFATPVTTAVPQLLEDFDDNSANGWTSVGGAWSVVTDGSKVFRQSDTTASLLARSSWNTTVASADQSVQAAVKPMAFNGSSFVSVHARYLDANNNYYVTLRNTKVFELKKIEGGVVTRIAQATLPASFNLMGWHSLRIDVTGTTTPVLKGYLDGEQLLTLTDNQSAPIAAANKAAVGTFGATAEFDNAIVTGL